MEPTIVTNRVDKNKVIRKVTALYKDHLSETPKKTARPAVTAALFARKAFKLRSVRATKFNAKHSKAISQGAETVLWLADTKPIRNKIVLEFHQYHNSVRVPGAGVIVIYDAVNNKVLSAENTTIEIKGDFPDGLTLMKSTKGFDSARLEKLLPIARNLKRVRVALETLDKETTQQVAPLLTAKPKFKVIEIEPAIIFFDKDKRKRPPIKSKDKDINLVERLLDITLPRLGKEITDKSYRSVTNVLFSSSIGKMTIHWRASFDGDTNTILYLEPLVEFNPTGLIFKDDPLTMTGDISLSPTASVTALNSVRSPQPLAGAVAPNLVGPYVSIQDICPISDTPPVDNAGTFDYSATTNDFAAVNAYYHNDALFRTVSEMGFDMSTYFDGTPFPVPVDHRGSFACVNAAAWSNGSGLAQFTYGLADPGSNIGITTDRRVVWHEFGHAILFDHVGSGNFLFAHSCGDGLAAIQCDPSSKAPDRFNTFPWIAISDRRHDRDPNASWNWGGPNDLGSYDSEQILATCHFRAYQSIGGDSKTLCDREWASRYMTFLILNGVGSLTPSNNPARSYLWSDVLQESDLYSGEFECHPGGTVHKVIRWAFEKQGAYPGTGGIQTVNSPPVVDVYIDDGRGGEYGYSDDWCNTKDIWNRCNDDGSPAHQEPDPCKDNFAYVIVRNRGLEDSKTVWIEGYHKRDNGCCDCCNDCKDLQWPTDFVQMATTRRRISNIPAGGYAIVGPFQWKPNPGDCMLFSINAKKDISNIKNVKPDQKVKLDRLVPWDNNIAIRCACKSC